MALLRAAREADSRHRLDAIEVPHEAGIAWAAAIAFGARCFLRIHTTSRQHLLFADAPAAPPDRVLFLGAMERRKGIDAFFAAAAIARERGLVQRWTAVGRWTERWTRQAELGRVELVNSAPDAALDRYWLKPASWWCPAGTRVSASRRSRPWRAGLSSSRRGSARWRKSSATAAC
jgi:glycosyltransferase involved in cell wall biosynthesis